MQKKSKNKELTNLEKIEKLSELFNEIVKIFPDGYSSLMIHNIDDIRKLDKKIWKLDSGFNDARNEFYLTADRFFGENNGSQITLFGKSVKADI